MKLLLNRTEVTNCVTGLTLSKTRSDAAACVEFSLIAKLADYYFPTLSAACGDRVQVMDDEGNTVFSGSIHRLDWQPEGRLCAVTAYDLGILLTRNELYGTFYGTPEAIIRQVCAQLGITVGSLATSGGVQLISTGTGMTAFAVLRQAFAGEYWLDGDNRLCCGAHRNVTVTLPPGGVVSATAVSTLEHMVNYAEVRGYQGAKNAVASAPAQIAQYGRFGRVYSLSGAISGAQAQANAALQGITREGVVTVLGDWRLICGGIAQLDAPDWGFSGSYLIRSVVHQVEQGVHLTELRLEKTE